MRTPTYGNLIDLELAGRYEAREADWRMGAVVYQVLVGPLRPQRDLAAEAAPLPRTQDSAGLALPAANTWTATSSGATRSISGAATWPARHRGWIMCRRLVPTCFT